MSEFRKGCWYVGIIMATIIVVVVATTETILWMGSNNPRTPEVIVLWICPLGWAFMYACAWVNKK